MFTEARLTRNDSFSISRYSRIRVHVLTLVQEIPRIKKSYTSLLVKLLLSLLPDYNKTPIHIPVPSYSVAHFVFLMQHDCFNENGGANWYTLYTMFTHCFNRNKQLHNFTSRIDNQHRSCIFIN